MSLNNPFIDPNNEFFGDSLIEQSSWTENFAASGNNTIEPRDLFNVNAATLSTAAATGERDQAETKPFFVTREKPASKLHLLVQGRETARLALL